MRSALDDSILCRTLLSDKLDLYLNEQDKELLSEVLEEIKGEFLYKAPFHGIHHSEKVMLFAYILGKKQTLSELEVAILIDASLYHDIGRETDSEDTLHGYASANLIEKVVKDKEIYKSKENLEILKFLCDAHSVPDERNDKILANYDIENKELAKKLLLILKDADALDRARFQKTSVAALKSCYLRSEYAKELIGFAHKLNAFYRYMINDRLYLGFSDITRDDYVDCMHGIGFNFPVFESILKYGILSNYAKVNEKLATTRNFYGNNGDNFISVCVGDGEAKREFIDTGISFAVEVPYVIKGSDDPAYARSYGFPIDSGLYSDERFVFYRIDRIRKIIIKPEFLDLDITGLNYLNGSNNYEAVVGNIDLYLNYLRLNFNYFPDITRIEALKAKYLEIIIAFEELSVESQRANQKMLFENIDSLKRFMSKEIGLMYEEAFKKVLNKDRVSVKDIMFYILNKQKIDYKFDNGSFTLKDFDPFII